MFHIGIDLGEELLQMIQKTLYEKVYSYKDLKQCEIRIDSLKNDAGIIGAGLLYKLN